MVRIQTPDPELIGLGGGMRSPSALVNVFAVRQEERVCWTKAGYLPLVFRRTFNHC